MGKVSTDRPAPDFGSFSVLTFPTAGVSPKVLWVFPSLNPCPHELDSDPILSDCFEQLSTKEAEKPHGQFFSIVYREIGDLKVIMSGEVDCSSSTDLELNRSIG